MLALLMTLAFGSTPELSGTYQLDQTQSELEQVHGKAVETTLESLPWAIRGLARSRVRRIITNCAHLAVQHTSAQVTLNCDEEPEHVIDLPAQGVTMPDRNGDPMIVTVDTDATYLTVTFATGQGGVTTRYRPDGDQLLVQKTLFSERLQGPVSWEVRYRRVP